MTDWPILSTVTFLPLVGVALLLLTRGDTSLGRRNILNVSLLTTVFTFVVSLFIWINFDNSNTGFQMVEKHAWLGTGISYHVGVDGISMPLIVLTVFFGVYPAPILDATAASVQLVADNFANAVGAVAPVAAAAH